jgi:hypothetical protein
VNRYQQPQRRRSPSRSLGSCGSFALPSLILLLATEGRGLCKSVIFLTGITTKQCHHSQVRINSWATFFNGFPPYDGPPIGASRYISYNQHPLFCRREQKSGFAAKVSFPPLMSMDVNGP